MIADNEVPERILARIQEFRKAFRAGGDAMAEAVIASLKPHIQQGKEAAAYFRAMIEEDRHELDEEVLGLLIRFAEVFEREASWLEKLCLDIMPEGSLQ